MAKDYFKFFLVFMITLVCCSRPNPEVKVTRKDPSIPLDYSFYLNNSINNTRKLKWYKIEIDTISDESNSWIEATFSFNRTEFIKIVADDIINKSANSFETNSNRFLEKSTIKIGQDLNGLIMDKAIQFSFDEGPLVIRKGRFEIFSNNISRLENDLIFDSILVAKDKNDRTLLPELMTKSKVDLLKIYSLDIR